MLEELGAADIPDLSGRTAVVTGANGGLGLETTRALAAASAKVVMASRNQGKATEAAEDIRGGAPDAALELDLASLASVRAAAEQILAAHPTIDILVNNAGVMGIPEGKTADGFETQLTLGSACIAGSTGMSPAQGALSQLRAATDPTAKSGQFYGPLFINSGPPVRKPILRRLGMNRAIERLWRSPSARPA